MTGIRSPFLCQKRIQRIHQIVAAYGNGDEVGVGDVNAAVLQLCSQSVRVLAIFCQIGQVIALRYLHLIGEGIANRIDNTAFPRRIASGNAVAQGQIDWVRRQSHYRQQAQAQGQSAE